VPCWSFIHPSAWKGNSAKSISIILHSPLLWGASKARLVPSHTKPKRYILWCRMDIHPSAWLRPSVPTTC
jgi:hypothetical protein